MQHEVLGRSNGKNDVRTKEGHRIALTDEELAVFEATGQLPELTPLSMSPPKPDGIEDLIAKAVEAEFNKRFSVVELEPGELMLSDGIEGRLALIEEKLGIERPEAPEVPATTETSNAAKEARLAELIGMPMQALKQVAEGHGIPVPVGSSKAGVAQLVIEKEFTS